jgi:hypothetical protein
MHKQLARTLTHIVAGEWGTCLVPLAPTAAYEVWVAPRHGLISADHVQLGEVVAVTLSKLVERFPHERWRVEIAAGIPAHTGTHPLIRMYAVTAPQFAFGLPILPETLIHTLLS